MQMCSMPRMRSKAWRSGEGGAGWHKVAVLGEGEEAWFEDVVVGVPCFWGDGFGRMGVHWRDVMLCFGNYGMVGRRI